MTKILSAAVLTVSDSRSEGKNPDTSGPRLKELIFERFAPQQFEYKLVPDDHLQIRNALIHLSDVLQIQLIITTGGTGFSKRDVTPEATRSIIEREAPQLAWTTFLYSHKITKFSALSRAISGIRGQSIIINMPGSKKAVEECFASIQDVIGHAVATLNDDKQVVEQTHAKVQRPIHVCPHKTHSGDLDDRNSIYPMVPVEQAIRIIFQEVQPIKCYNWISTMNVPPFRSSLKDGYALKGTAKRGLKRVLKYISAGDALNTDPLTDEECFKINTGAAIPTHTNCVIQIEDTKLIEKDGDVEKVIEILVDCVAGLDIREIGSDLEIGEPLTITNTFRSNDIVDLAMLACIGDNGTQIKNPRIGIISTGDELVTPDGHTELPSGKIFDSNTKMLEQCLLQFGLNVVQILVVNDNYNSVVSAIESMQSNCEFIISTGGVSMGDKDYVKNVLIDLGYKIHFGRVNMKPGKPMTYASDNRDPTKPARHFFGLPGNPVSAFVTFHLMVLPALRRSCNFLPAKCFLPVIDVQLESDQLELDPRPEYMRASLSYVNGRFFGKVTGNQISSRLKSLHGADALLHFPARTDEKTCMIKGDVVKATILNTFFLSSS